MKHWRTKILTFTIMVVLLGSIVTIAIPSSSSSFTNLRHFSTSADGNQTPLRRIVFVAPDSNSYIDEFAYISAISASVFNENGTQYISPLIYSTGSSSESWFLEDWIDYLSTDGGLTQAISVGDFSESYLANLQYSIGQKIYPRITGTTSAEIAAKIAVSEWHTSDIAVISLARDDFQTSGVITGNSSHTFLNDASQLDTFGGSVTGVTTPSSITFTPPTWAGWLEGSFNWTGTEILTHELIDPNGEIVDYSVYNQVYFSRHPGYVASPVPLHFWLPKTADGVWTMNVTRATPGTTSMNCEVLYHPGYSQSVSIPSNAKWLNVTLNWDNVATDLNLALVDPNGRLVMWAPAGSILSNPGRETIQLPYPMEGNWNIIASWMGATNEQNNINLSWRISRLPIDLQNYLESASNGAVLASLLNAPLLYAEPTQVPQITQWALDRLNVSTVWFVDVGDLQQTSLITELSASATVLNLNSYSAISGNITELSKSSDIVVTVPTGDNSEFIGPAAYSAAVHGAPIFSLSSNDNQMITRAQETWAPYLIGPEINNIYVINKYENRAENGWYDERIPNKYSMMKSVDDFESFLSVRGARNATEAQSCVIVAPMSLLPSSFDRSLQCAFNPGRIPAEEPSTASVLINRGLLHRYLFLTAESSDTALISMYAYTDGAQFVDNALHYSVLFQIENSTDALEAAGFGIESHVGATETFAQLNSQVALWSLSTHGTLTLLPRDPPNRPYGPGYFSMRNGDKPFGFEVSELERESSSDADKLVNPVVFTAEASNHVTRSTKELDSAIGNIGSPIVILTACLLGGTDMPLMLMKHGAVAVTASPRTVYFQPAGMLSVLMAQSLSQGDTIGEALSYGLSLTSSDFADPLVGRDPRDYANQQILFGDPSIQLYEPSASPHISAVDPTTEVFGNHVPTRGVPSIAALGSSTYLPDALSPLMVDYDYYEPSNFSEFLPLLSLRYTVIIEPSTLSLFTENLSSYTSGFDTYMRSGGVLAVLGVTESLPWIPWPMSYDSFTDSDPVTYVEETHPLLMAPNTINTTTGHTGHFTSVWANLTILATTGSNPVIVAGTYGSGKVTLTTTNPTGSIRDAFIENIVMWSFMPSICLRQLSQSQSIVWAGDHVTFTIRLSDFEGNPIESVNLHLWLNETEMDVVENGDGYYTVVVSEAWTSANQGIFDLRFYISKSGFDTLSLVFEQYLLVRPFPWVVIIILGGIVATVIVGWVYIKRKRGDSFSFRREKKGESKPKKRLKEEEEKRKEEDGKFDPKEYFGV
ncbi:MAG: hypothetical protein ACFFCT_09955 [Candidatus Odinarchaeota archaeon]